MCDTFYLPKKTKCVSQFRNVQLCLHAFTAFFQSSFSVHHQNISSLAIEIYKAINNSPVGNLSRFFVRSNHNYNLRSGLELLLPNVNTIFKGENSAGNFRSLI